MQSSQPVQSSASTVCMLLARADDRIDGAGRQALRAADAAGFVDLRDEKWSFDAVGGVQRQGRAAEQIRAAHRS